MKEKELIRIIKSSLGSEYIGDDCAYLKDLNIVITQDSLVEDVHFLRDFISPYQLGYKSVMVNISDVCASGAEPVYLTVSLSLPSDVDENFVKSFYEGAKEAAQKAIIVGGDITGSDKIYISVTAVGNAKDRKISSRSHAKPGYKVIVSGEHGNSAHGLKLLLNGVKENNKYINAHLMPEAQREFSKQIAQNADCDYAMMDSSDGLADALMQIAKASNVVLKVDTSKIPHDKNIDMSDVLYGGEDYQLVAVVPEYFLNFVDRYTVIGEAEIFDISGIVIDGKFYDNIDKDLYNHFEDDNEN